MSGYELRGRRVLIEFTCGRCGKTRTEPYSKQADSAEGNLHCFKPPTGWLDDGLYKPMLCEDCHRAYKEFMQNKK